MKYVLTVSHTVRTFRAQMCICHSVVQRGKVLCFSDDIMMICTSEYEIKREHWKKDAKQQLTKEKPKQNKGCVLIQIYSVTHH